MQLRRPQTLVVALLALPLAGAPCGGGPKVNLNSPVDGLFTTSNAVAVEGSVKKPPAGSSLEVNGVPVPFNLSCASQGGSGSNCFSSSVPIGPLMNEVVVELLNSQGGSVVKHRRTVIQGPSASLADFSPESVIAHVTYWGVQDHLERELEDALRLQFNCLEDAFLNGDFGDFPVRSVSFHGPDLDITTWPGRVDVDFGISDVYVGFKEGICSGNITADSVTAQASLAIEPNAGDPATLQVNYLQYPDVTVTGADGDAGGVLCSLFNFLEGDPLGEMIDRVEPVLEEYLSNIDNSNVPTGQGCNNQLAERIDEIIAGLEGTGGLAGALANVDAAVQWRAVEEAFSGVRLELDTRLDAVSVPAGAPDLSHYYNVSGTSPDLAALWGNDTPGGSRYDAALGLNTGFFNQASSAATRAGLLNFELTELAGTPLTAGLVSFILPPFSVLPPNRLLAIRFSPTTAPIVTWESGSPGGAFKLRVQNMTAEILEVPSHTPPITGTMKMRFGLDALIGADFQVDVDNRTITPVLHLPGASQLNAVLLKNTLGGALTTAQLENLVEQILPQLFPFFEDLVPEVALPTLGGVSVRPVELATYDETVLLFNELNDPPEWSWDPNRKLNAPQPPHTFDVQTTPSDLNGDPIVSAWIEGCDQDNLLTCTVDPVTHQMSLEWIAGYNADQGKCYDFTFHATDGELIRIATLSLATGCWDMGEPIPPVCHGGLYAPGFSCSGIPHERLPRVVRYGPVLAFNPMGPLSGRYDLPISVTVNASHPVAGTIMFTTVEPLPAGANFTWLAPYATGVFSWTPTLAQLGPWDLRFEACDTLGNCQQQVLNIEVTDEDLHPEADTPVPDVHTLEHGQSAHSNLSGHSPDGDDIVFSMTGAPPTASLFQTGPLTANWDYTARPEDAGWWYMDICVTEQTPNAYQDCADLTLYVDDDQQF